MIEEGCTEKEESSEEEEKVGRERGSAEIEQTRPTDQTQGKLSRNRTDRQRCSVEAKGAMMRGTHNLIKVRRGERTEERQTREELSEVYSNRRDGSYK